MWTWLPILHWSTEQVWASIRASGVPYHPAYDQGMSRLSCSLCVLGSRADLIRGCQLRPELADEYAELEHDIGHQFRADVSMTQLIAESRRQAPPAPTTSLPAVGSDDTAVPG